MSGIIDVDYKIWISVEQRLDGMISRWGPDPYVTVVIDPGKEWPNIKFQVTPALAKLLARGLNKAVKRAVAP